MSPHAFSKSSSCKRGFKRGFSAMSTVSHHQLLERTRFGQRKNLRANNCAAKDSLPERAYEYPPAPPPPCRSANISKKLHPTFHHLFNSPHRLERNCSFAPHFVLIVLRPSCVGAFPCQHDSCTRSPGAAPADAQLERFLHSHEQQSRGGRRRELHAEQSQPGARGVLPKHGQRLER